VSPGRILVVRLPCRKVFPTGPLYLLSALHAASPGTVLQGLDLALEPAAKRWPSLRQALDAFHPDLVAFSWRDIQIFSPQDLDGALRDAFVVFHDPSFLRKALAAFRGLRDIIIYRSALATNLRLIRRAARRARGAAIALGGPSARIFGDRLRAKLPRGVRVFSEAGLGEFFASIGLPAPADPLEPGIDLPFLEASFPALGAYRDEVVAVQTKQGCPHECLYCLYGYLEGKKVRHRDPARVVDEIQGYVKRWGTRRFWFADAQLLSVPADHRHLAAILGGILDRRLAVEWSGYLRIHEIDAALAGLMVRSGLTDLEVSINSGAQEIVDGLRLGFRVEDVMQGLSVLKEAGYARRLFLNLSLNAPGETEDTLRQTIAVVRRATALFGDGLVVPVVFFLAIQPHTGLERAAIQAGHIRAGYNPLSVLPWNVLKLIYNPPPLGRIIGRACVRAFADGADSPGTRVLAEIERELEGKHVI